MLTVLSIFVSRPAKPDGTLDAAGPLKVDITLPGKGAAQLVFTPDPGQVVVVDPYELHRVATQLGGLVNIVPAAEAAFEPA